MMRFTEFLYRKQQSGYSKSYEFTGGAQPGVVIQNPPRCVLDFYGSFFDGTRVLFACLGFAGILPIYRLCKAVGERTQNHPMLVSPVQLFCFSGMYLISA